MSEKGNGHHDLDEVSVESFEDDELESIELTPEQQLQKELDLERKSSEDLLDQMQRLQAEFDNYRKRIGTRVDEATKYASEGILLKVLEVYDNISRALQADFSEDSKSAKAGIDAIQKQMDKLLSQEEVRSFDSLGKPFDPYYQHAINTESDPEKSDNLVIEEYQKGYMLRERVLRPALVCVNRHEIPNGTSKEEQNEIGDD
ncbi:MAG: nucleotide exchange factor GrpE [Candidatus Thorarchaeota archaeon]